MEQRIVSVADFGSRIRKERKKQGLTQQQLAAFFASFSREFLSDLENGKPTVELGKALKVASALGLRLMIADGAKAEDTE
ncbi:MAG: helix-turn-helix domain-containing protein, partial [Coriobacteriales bacterium]|nr:helix-turn-helix domain-containing protein [Coriobacteriales bacterium]